MFCIRYTCLVKFEWKYYSILIESGSKSLRSQSFEIHSSYLFSLPWNQQTFSGWIYELFFSLILCTCYCLINGAILSFFMGLCEFHMAFRNHFNTLIQNMDEIDSKFVDSASKNRQMKLLLSEAIKFHVSVKEYECDKFIIFKS